MKLAPANVNEAPLGKIKRSGFEAIIGAGRVMPNLNEVDAATR